MSTSDLYMLNQKSVRWLTSYRNGWGSAPIIWDYLSDKYIPEKPAYSLDGSHMDKVWALQNDDRLTFDERMALLFTFDRAYIPVEHLRPIGEAFRRLFRELVKPVNMLGRVNHWNQIGKDLIALSEMRASRHARGVAIACTSVNDVWGSSGRREWIENAWPIVEEVP